MKWGRCFHFSYMNRRWQNDLWNVRTVCFINMWHCVCESVGFICLSLVSVAMAMFPLSCLWTRLVKWVKVIFPLQDHTSDKGWWVLYSNTHKKTPCKHSRSHRSTSFPYGHYSFMMISNDNFAFMMCSWMYSVGSDRQMVLLSFNLSLFLTPPCWNHSCASDSSPLCFF